MKNSVPVCSVTTWHGATGWACSLLLHVGVVMVAVGSMARLTLAPEKEPFRWEVAFVHTSPTAPTGEPLSEVMEPESAKTQPSHFRSTPASPETVPQVVETESVSQPVQREVQKTVERVQPVPQTAAVGDKAVVQHRMEQTNPVPTPVESAEEVRENKALVEATPVTQTVMTTEGFSQPSPVIAEAKPESTLVTKEATPTESVTAPGNSMPVSKEPETPSRAAVQEPTPAAPVTAAPLEAQTTASVVREGSTQVAAAPRAGPPAKADYGWLAQSLYQRVVELKRYPHEARLNRWGGKVVLKAVIREDGQLGELRVQESSGYDVLDEEAMRMVREACPLHLKYPLGRPEVAIQIPITYALR